ncbi:MAG: hypothetical protein NT099_06605 [Candidatus Saganbacteria bacterium]|nr:hypothetical protein [Candidatus Saganbacteria bacterium]
MTPEELDLFLEKNLDVEWMMDEEGNLLLRHPKYFQAEEKLKIEPKALPSLTVPQLEKLLVGGKNVEHITRITGYFSRVSGWNKGKKGELQDRHRVKLD